MSAGVWQRLGSRQHAAGRRAASRDPRRGLTPIGREAVAKDRGQAPPLVATGMASDGQRINAIQGAARPLRRRSTHTLQETP